MHRLSCVGLGCIFTSFPPWLPFSPLAFPPVSPVPVLALSWRPGRAEQQFQPRVSLERWELPVAPGTVPWGAAEGRCSEELEKSRRVTGARREKLKASSKSSEGGPAAATLQRAWMCHQLSLSRRAALHGRKRPREGLWRWGSWDPSAHSSV